MPKKQKLRVFEAFAGIGAQAAALKRLNIDYEIVGISDWFIDAIECYIDALKYAILSKTGKSRFPNDRDFVEKFAMFELYNAKSSVRKYIFERLENYKSRERVAIEDQIEKGQLTIEHIMPQTLTTEWQRHLGGNYEFIHAKYKDTVIFVTNMSQYAVKGYEVRAFDFIVKPVSYSNFSIKLAGAVSVIRQRTGKDLWISNKEGKTCIRSSRVKYIEVNQHVLVFHTLDGDYTQSGTLSNIQDELAGEPFSLCNRCYLVNLRYVTAVKQFDVYLGTQKLQISRPKRTGFLRDLNNYLAKGC